MEERSWGRVLNIQETLTLGIAQSSTLQISFSLSASSLSRLSHNQGKRTPFLCKGGYMLWTRLGCPVGVGGAPFMRTPERGEGETAQGGPTFRKQSGHVISSDYFAPEVLPGDGVLQESHELAACGRVLKRKRDVVSRKSGPRCPRNNKYICFGAIGNKTCGTEREWTT